jgi:hypothetical protein
MRRVFKNDNLEKEFHKQGFVRTPFLNTEEVHFLKEKFFELLPNSGGFHGPQNGLGDDDYQITYDFTFIDKNIEYKKAVFDTIVGVFENHFNTLLADYKPIIANYIRKKNEGGEVPLHQNWAFVDEKKCTSVSIWCPLVDSSIENGTLQLVPQSHKRFGQIRGPLVPWELEGIKNEIIQKHLIPLETKAGDAVILDDSIVHYSAINKTPGLRLTIQLILIPNEVPSIHYHLNPKNQQKLVDVLEVDRDFYMQFNPWKEPENVKLLKQIPFQQISCDENTFVKKLSEKAFDQPKGIFSFFKNFTANAF